MNFFTNLLLLKSAPSFSWLIPFSFSLLIPFSFFLVNSFFSVFLQFLFLTLKGRFRVLRDKVSPITFEHSCISSPCIPFHHLFIVFYIQVLSTKVHINNYSLIYWVWLRILLKLSSIGNSRRYSCEIYGSANVFEIWIKIFLIYWRTLTN